MSWLLAAAVAVLTLHCWVNATFWLRRLPAGATVDERVSVLLPLRNEAGRVGPCLRALLAQRGVPGLEIVVLDDGSTDGTADVVRAIARANPRPAKALIKGSAAPKGRGGAADPLINKVGAVRLVTGAALPTGWLGKPHACHQLAAHADPKATALVFVDADVVLAPDAVAAIVAALRAADVQLLSPYPRIVVRTVGERLVQPLLQWSWLTFLPLRAVERSSRPSLAAAGGQLLVVDRAGYDRAGGHAAVRGRILEDIELARLIKRSGGRIALADGSGLATCGMYGSWRELTAGYTKSLWAAFPSPAGAAAVVALLLGLYAAPLPIAIAAGAAAAAGVAAAGGVAATAAVAYLLGVAGRVVAARSTGGRAWPDAFAHPVSIVLFAVLIARSYDLRRRGRLSWRGRPVGSGLSSRTRPEGTP